MRTGRRGEKRRTQAETMLPGVAAVVNFAADVGPEFLGEVAESVQEDV
jgi:hypothetical protein